MKKCKYCECEFLNQAYFIAHLRKCLNYKKFVASITKEVLYKLYVEEKKSLPEIRDFFDISHLTLIYRLFKKYGIQTRTCKESCNDNKLKKYKKTCFEKYGVEHNLSKNSPFRKKMMDKLLKEEGITNVFQRKETKLKILNTLIEKYGSLDEWQLLTRNNNGNCYYSKIHKQVVDILLNNKIECKLEFKIKGNRQYSFDILILDNKIIEVYGDYWHANPIFYKSTDIINKRTSGEITALDKWNYDKQKIEYANSYNYSVLIVWEHDLKNNVIETTDKILKYANQD